MAEIDKSKLYITISYQKPSGGGDGDKKEKDEDEHKLGDYAIHELIHILKSQSITALNSSVAMIGNLSGEYFKQMKIQEGLNNVSKLTNVFMGAIAGAKLSGGHPLGALIGAGSVVIGEAVNWGFSRVNFEASMSKQSRDIELLRQRSGMNSLYDNSRGTED